MKKTSKCHYISQVYLRQWGKDDNRDHINIYDKVKKENIESGFSIENNFYKTNLYNIKFSDSLSYLGFFPLIKEDFKNMIKNFKKKNDIEIYYLDKFFELENQNLGLLIDKDNIEFKKNGSAISKKQKNFFYNELTQLKSTVIEEKYSKQIESKWNDLLEYILEFNKTRVFLNSPYILLKEKDMDLLRDMTVTMILRIENTPGHPNISKTVENICSILKEEFIKIFETEKAGCIFNDFPSLNFLKNNYVDLFQKKNSLYRNKLFNEMILNYEMYIINNKCDLEFYTSDVPCFIVNNNFEIDKRNNGIYFPITPKILLILKIDTELKNSIRVFEINENKVKYYNNLIYNKAQKYIIFKNKFKC